MWMNDIYGNPTNLSQATRIIRDEDQVFAQFPGFRTPVYSAKQAMPGGNEDQRAANAEKMKDFLGRALVRKHGTPTLTPEKDKGPAATGAGSTKKADAGSDTAKSTKPRKRRKNAKTKSKKNEQK